MKMLITLFATLCLAMCETLTPEQIKSLTDAAAAINSAAVTDYKTIHAIKHSK